MKHARSMLEWSLIGTGLVILFATLAPAIGGDGAVRFESVLSLLHGEGGFSKFSLVQPMLSMPLAWLAVARGSNPAGYVAYFNLLVFLLLAMPAYAAIARRYTAATARAWVLLILGASMFPHHLQGYYGEVLSAMCFFVGALWIERRPVPSVLLIALACASTPALLLPYMVLAAMWFILKRRIAPPVAAIGAVALILLDVWIRNAGSGNGYLSDNEHGFQTILPYSARPGFSYPLVFGTLSILFSFGKGLVFYIPALMLAVNAESRAALRLDTKSIIIVSLALIAPVLLYAKWWAWYGGSFWGPRFFLYLCPPACLLMAVLLQERRMSIMRTLCLVAVVALSAWVAVNGYIYAQDNMDACWSNNYSQEYLCWYVPEFSALWRPFVTGRFEQLFDYPRWPYAVWTATCVCYLIGLAVRNALGSSANGSRSTSHPGSLI